MLDRAAAFFLVGLLAWLHGTGRESDAYYIAYWLPVVVLTVVGEAAFAYIVPKLRRLSSHDEELYVGHTSAYLRRSWRPVLIVVSGYLLAVVPVTTALSWAFGSETRELALEMGFLYAGYVGMMALTAIVGAIAAGWNRHDLNAYVNPASTVAIAISVLGLHTLGLDIYSFPIGAMAGQVIAFCAVLLPLAIRAWRLGRSPLAPRHPADSPSPMFWSYSTLSVLSLPVMVPVLVVGLERGLAGTLGLGTAAILGFARTPLIAPGLVAAPIGNGLLARIDEDGSATWRADVARSLDVAMVVGVTATVGLGLLGEPLLASVFLHGEFSAKSVEETYVALLFFLSGLLGMVVFPIAVRLLQARRNVRGIVGATSCFLLYPILAWALSRSLGAGGLAFAFGLASSASGIVALHFIGGQTLTDWIARWWRGLTIVASAILAHVLSVRPHIEWRRPTDLLMLLGITGGVILLVVLVQRREFRLTVAWVQDAVRGNESINDNRDSY